MPDQISCLRMHVWCNHMRLSFFLQFGNGNHLTGLDLGVRGSGGSNPPFGNLATTIHYDIVCSFVVKKAHTKKLIALRIDTLVITCVHL